jgi:hypothetical protein
MISVQCPIFDRVQLRLVSPKLPLTAGRSGSRSVSSLIFSLLLTSSVTRRTEGSSEIVEWRRGGVNGFMWRRFLWCFARTPSGHSRRPGGLGGITCRFSLVFTPRRPYMAWLHNSGGPVRPCIHGPSLCSLNGWGTQSNSFGAVTPSTIFSRLPRGSYWRQ